MKAITLRRSSFMGFTCPSSRPWPAGNITAPASPARCGRERVPPGGVAQQALDWNVAQHQPLAAEGGSIAFLGPDRSATQGVAGANGLSGLPGPTGRAAAYVSALEVRLAALEGPSALGR
jgi:hypothetical protein